MKKELKYFKINNCFGGNQDWFIDPMMHLGGCAAATACDVCIDMACNNGMGAMYPFDVSKLSRHDYVKFAMQMKPYLKPRMSGVNRLDIFIDGFEDYLDDAGIKGIAIRGFSSDMPEDEAKEKIREQLDKDIPIPFLVLNHNNRDFKDFHWHWFILAGYEEFGGDFMTETVTYGESRWVDFHELWNSGYKENGGMILLGTTE
jgi:hypothetical protein